MKFYHSLKILINILAIYLARKFYIYIYIDQIIDELRMVW